MTTWLLLLLVTQVSAQCSYNIHFTNGPTATNVTFLHFNDNYLIEGGSRTVNGVSQPYGGAARLKTVVDQNPGAIVVFSGDLFFPSGLSSLFDGRQMVDVFNMVGITAAVPGNHEFDKGIPTARSLFGNSTFPWIVANLIDPATNSSIFNMAPTMMVERNGIKVGLLGLISDWRAVTPIGNNYGYVDIVQAGRRYAQQLIQQGAQIVVAVTHADKVEDDRLVREVPEIDLVLGGHDHDFQSTSHVNGVVIWKSMQDLNYVGVITAQVGCGYSRIRTSYVQLNGSIAEDPTVKARVQSWQGRAQNESRTVGTLGVELVVTNIRTQETNAGNLVADALAWEAKQRVANIGTTPVVALVNAGAIRGSNLPAGPITTYNLLGLIPFDNIVYVLNVTGAVLKSAVENGLKLLPAAAGRFPQISGFSFVYDSAQTYPQRVKQLFNATGGEIKDTDYLLLSTLAFIGKGGDEYTMLSPITPIVNELNGRDSRVVVADYIGTFNGPVSPTVSNRIRIQSSNFHFLHKVLQDYATEDVYHVLRHGVPTK